MQTFSSNRDGCVKYSRIQSSRDESRLCQLSKFREHPTSVLNVDATARHVISSSQHTIKVRRRSRDNAIAVKHPLFPQMQKNMCGDGGPEDKSRTVYNSSEYFVSSLLFNPDGTKFAASGVLYAGVWSSDSGSDDLDSSAILIYDINGG